MAEVKIIAEIGWNHMGDMNLAEKMIIAAKESGADFAKFQTWQTKNLKPGEWDNDGRTEIYRKAELSKSDYSDLFEICKNNKIHFLTSLFNEKDYELISHLPIDTIKIPSPENRNKKLIEFCDNNYKNIFLSTGAATIDEISESYKLFNKAKNVYLFHCVSRYPCEDQHINLPRIDKLKEITTNIGISDHSIDILSSLLSLNKGIKFIEKHFTIDKKLPGRDNAFAILPQDLKELSNTIKRYELMLESTSLISNSDKDIRQYYAGRWAK
tara:strand:- start:25062 stop:25868 length:807 start_codon:yes stop_codon:yes gene_type:complete